VVAVVKAAMNLSLVADLVELDFLIQAVAVAAHVERFLPD
jgi:hypothetical protein